MIRRLFTRKRKHDPKRALAEAEQLLAVAQRERRIAELEREVGIR